MNFRFRLGSWLAMALASTSIGHAAIGQTPSVSSLYVNAEQGDDANPGSQFLPFLTLNRALEVAWVLKQPVGNPPMIAHVEIKVIRTDTPIAPLEWGGVESFGWQTPSEKSAGTPHKAFPLRMVKGVDVIGVSRNGQKPRILIDEVIGGAFPTGNWEAGLPKAYVWMADNVELRGLLLSGNEYAESRATHSLKAVYARATVGTTIDSCEIWNFHDGVFFDAQTFFDPEVEPNGEWKQEVCTGSIRHSYLHDFFPVAADPGDAQNKGHAAVWLVGAGVTDVDLVDVEIVDAHDAVEIMGELDAVSGLATTATLDMTECNLHDIENGAEVVGVGTLDFSITDGDFTRCSNKPIGTPTSEPTAAIAVRGMSVVHGEVRDSRFENNAYSAVWGMTPVAPSLLDLGTGSDLGNNVFMPFDFTVSPSDDVYRVHLFQKSASGTNSLVSAVGNTWIPGQQGAHPTTGCMPIGLRQGAENLPNLGVNDGPPGPFAGEFQSFGVPWNRNYSIAGAGGWINFGSACP